MNVFELFATLNLDSSGYEKGLDDSESKGKSFASGLGKTLGGAAKAVGAASVAAVGAAATGITTLTTQAVQAYGSYEQLVGGVNKIFGESADLVMENAAKAFQTAGMSANQYMETVTSFSASLIQSLGGDTEAAAEYANMAIADMSDNANTFGTDIQSIQNAYQGFAKQNYTMLDNLKLGYGGTKSEMERLLQDAAALSDEFELQYDDSENLVYGYADIVEAIHIVQENMQITGTTAKEASDTIQGTAGSLQAAWQNLIIGLGDANADLGPLIDNVVASALQMVNNIKPIALQAVKGIAALIEGFAPVLAEELPPLIMELLPTLADAIVMLINAVSGVLPDLIGAILPPLLSALTGVIMSLLQALPQILQVLSQQLPIILQQLIPAILSLLPLLIQTGLEFIMAIGMGLADNIDLLMSAIMQIIHYLVDELLTPDNIAQFINVALQIILAIAEGIIVNIPEILGAIAVLIWNIIEGIGTALPDIGLQIVTFIVDLGENLAGLFEEWFGDTGRNLFATIGEWFNGIYQWGVSVAQWVVNGINNIKQKVSTFFTNIGSFFSNGFNNMKEKVNSGLNAIKEKFTGIFEKVKTTVKNAIEFIKGLFKFDWSLPSIKLPHFSVSGSLDLFAVPPQIPKVGIEWYKKAYDEPYLLNDATIFGAAGGKLLGGGEGSGSEVVVGTNKLMSMMKQAVGATRPITINIYGAEGQDVRELAKAVSVELQNLINDKESVYA